MSWIDLSDQNWPNGHHEYSWARLVFRHVLFGDNSEPHSVSDICPSLQNTCKDVQWGCQCWKETPREEREKLTSRSSAGEGGQVQAPLWNLEFQFPDVSVFKHYLENLISGPQNQRFWFRRSGVESGFWFLTLAPWDSAVGVWLTIRFSDPELNTLVRKGTTENKGADKVTWRRELILLQEGGRRERRWGKWPQSRSNGAGNGVPKGEQRWVEQEFPTTKRQRELFLIIWGWRAAVGRMLELSGSHPGPGPAVGGPWGVLPTAKCHSDKPAAWCGWGDCVSLPCEHRRCSPCKSSPGGDDNSYFNMNINSYFCPQPWHRVTYQIPREAFISLQISPEWLSRRHVLGPSVGTVNYQAAFPSSSELSPT